MLVDINLTLIIGYHGNEVTGLHKLSLIIWLFKHVIQVSTTIRNILFTAFSGYRDV